MQLRWWSELLSASCLYIRGEQEFGLTTMSTDVPQAPSCKSTSLRLLTSLTGYPSFPTGSKIAVAKVTCPGDAQIDQQPSFAFVPSTPQQKSSVSANLSIAITTPVHFLVSFETLFPHLYPQLFPFALILRHERRCCLTTNPLAGPCDQLTAC